MVQYQQFPAAQRSCYSARRRYRPRETPLLESACAAVVHRHGAVAERPRRDQLELPRRGQTALVQGGAMASEPGMNEELVLVDQLEPVELSGQLAAAEEHALRSRVLEPLHA